mmetsp:Transcript_65385/g.153906  ORF Transcript_65385/g.153906 Transcript_65385/m.153906 type:complete len:372 (-) Transcript_65385:229-1344(-)
MHSHLAKHGAVGAVEGVGRNRANHVRWIDVLDGERQTEGLESRGDGVFQPWAHVSQNLVATCICSTGALDQRITAALCHDDDRMALRAHQVLRVLENLLQVNVHLWNKANVHVPRSQGCVHRNESAMAAHKFDKANAVGVATCLHVRGIYSLGRLRAGSVKAEGLVDHRNVVVDRLGHANDRTLMVNFHHAIEGLHGSLVGPVTTQHKVLPDILGLKCTGHIHVRRVAAITDKHGAALRVDIPHHFWRQLQPLLRLQDSLVAALDAVDAANTIGPKRVHDLADHAVQTRANAATADNGSSRGRVMWVEVQHLPRSCTCHLEVRHALARIKAIPKEQSLRGPGEVVAKQSDTLESGWDVEGAIPLTQVETLQ